MIISAPEVGPMIAGFTLSNVNTRTGGSRCGATDFTSGNAHGNAGRSSEWTRIKRRAAQGAGNTRTALTRPLPTRPEGGQAMQKPRSSLYAMPGGLAVTAAGQPVVNLTASVVA